MATGSAQAPTGPFLAAWRRWLPLRNGRRATLVSVGVVRHAITHHRLAIHVIGAADIHGSAAQRLPPHTKLVDTAQLNSLPLSSLARKCLAVRGL
jgi:hypothetical protein